jgi:hypothetical protein
VKKMGVKPNQYFILDDGTKIKNLYQLSQALEQMPEEVFNRHVNEEKNDFFNWVLEVHKDQELASQIAAAKTAKAMKNYINKKIKTTPKKVKNLRLELKDEPVKEKSRFYDKVYNFLFINKSGQKEEAKFDSSQEKHSQIFKKLTKVFGKNKCDEPIEPMKVDKHKAGEPVEPMKVDKHKPEDPVKIKEHNCPFKNIKCALLEFLLGIVVGLLIGFAVYSNL